MTTLTHIHDHIMITQQLLQETLEMEDAIQRHQERLHHDPLYAAEWHRQQAEREHEWDD